MAKILACDLAVDLKSALRKRNPLQISKLDLPSIPGLLLGVTDDWSTVPITYPSAARTWDILDLLVIFPKYIPDLPITK